MKPRPARLSGPTRQTPTLPIGVEARTATQPTPWTANGWNTGQPWSVVRRTPGPSSARTHTTRARCNPPTTVGEPYGPSIQTLSHTRLPPATTLRTACTQAMGRQHQTHQDRLGVSTTETRTIRHAQRQRHLPRLRQARCQRSRPHHPPVTRRSRPRQQHGTHTQNTVPPREK